MSSEVLKLKLAITPNAYHFSCQAKLLCAKCLCEEVSLVELCWTVLDVVGNVRILKTIVENTHCYSMSPRESPQFLAVALSDGNYSLVVVDKAKDRDNCIQQLFQEQLHWQCFSSQSK